MSDQASEAKEEKENENENEVKEEEEDDDDEWEDVDEEEEEEEEEEEDEESEELSPAEKKKRARKASAASLKHKQKASSSKRKHSKKDSEAAAAALKLQKEEKEEAEKSTAEYLLRLVNYYFSEWEKQVHSVFTSTSRSSFLAYSSSADQLISGAIDSLLLSVFAYAKEKYRSEQDSSFVPSLNASPADLSGLLNFFIHKCTVASRQGHYQVCLKTGSQARVLVKEWRPDLGEKGNYLPQMEKINFHCARALFRFWTYPSNVGARNSLCKKTIDFDMPAEKQSTAKNEDEKKYDCLGLFDTMNAMKWAQILNPDFLSCKWEEEEEEEEEEEKEEDSEEEDSEEEDEEEDEESRQGRKAALAAIKVYESLSSSPTGFYRNSANLYAELSECSLYLRDYSNALKWALKAKECGSLTNSLQYYGPLALSNLYAEMDLLEKVALEKEEMEKTKHPRFSNSGRKKSKKGFVVVKVPEGEKEFLTAAIKEMRVAVKYARECSCAYRNNLRLQLLNLLLRKKEKDPTQEVVLIAFKCIEYSPDFAALFNFIERIKGKDKPLGNVPSPFPLRSLEEFMNPEKK